MALLRVAHVKGLKREDMLFRKFTFETTLVSKRRQHVAHRDGYARYNIINRPTFDHLDPKKPRHQLHVASSASKIPSADDATSSVPSSKTCDAEHLNEPLSTSFAEEFNSLPLQETLLNSEESDVARVVSRRVGKKNDCSDDVTHGSEIMDKDKITNTMRLLTVKGAEDDRSTRPLSGRASIGRPRLRWPNKVSFSSAEEGIRQGRLFHTVSQTPLRIAALEMEDSDAEDVGEKEWRFRLRRDEIVEYVDTLPAESLFMNLWNQFVGMEYNLDSDRQMSHACYSFVKSKLAFLFCTTLPLETFLFEQSVCLVFTQSFNYCTNYRGNSTIV